MSKINSARIQQHFENLTDPRRREVTYPLINVVVIAVCAVIYGADDFVAIAKFGRTKRNWFARFLDLANGIPSHDRFNAILAALQPAEYEKYLLGWMAALHEITAGQVIAIDGKTLRRSFDKANSKSAIPKLLELLEISGSLITIDALGCQTEIAKQIVASKVDIIF